MYTPLRILFILSIFFSAILATNSPTYAHSYASNEEVTLELHIDPDHTPIAGKFNLITLKFAGTSRWVTLRDCDCDVAIYKDAQQLAQFKNISPDNNKPNTFSTNYVFNTPGMYQLKMYGTPKTRGVFAPFLLNINITVDQPGSEATQTRPSSNSVHHLKYLSIILIAIIGISTLIFYRNRKTKSYELLN